MLTLWCNFVQASLPVHNQVLPSIESVDDSDPLATLQNPMGRLEAKEEEDEDEDEDTEEDEEEDGEDTDLDDWGPDPPRPFDPHDLCKYCWFLWVGAPVCGHCSLLCGPHRTPPRNSEWGRQTVPWDFGFYWRMNWSSGDARQPVQCDVGVSSDSGTEPMSSWYQSLGSQTTMINLSSSGIFSHFSFNTFALPLLQALVLYIFWFVSCCPQSYEVGSFPEVILSCCKGQDSNLSRLAPVCPWFTITLTASLYCLPVEEGAPASTYQIIASSHRFSCFYDKVLVSFIWVSRAIQRLFRALWYTIFLLGSSICMRPVLISISKRKLPLFVFSWIHTF